MGKNSPNAKLFGIDVNEALIERAKIEVPNAKFICANIFKDQLDQRFDMIFMLSVHAMFDSIDEWFCPLVGLLQGHKTPQ